MQTIDLTLEDTPWPTVNQLVSPAISFMGYLSDISDDELLPEDQDHEDNEREDEAAGNTPSMVDVDAEPSFSIWPPPPLKWCCLDVPVGDSGSVFYSRVVRS